MNSVVIEIGGTSAQFSNPPIFNPGSVIQGTVLVKAQTPVHASRVRIVFHATESVLIKSMDNDSLVSARASNEQLFGSQHILWKADVSELCGEYEYPFTMEMPMVQFPPTVNTMPNYACIYKFSAFLETASGQEYNVLLKAKTEITFQPFIETRPEKLWRPLILKSTHRQPGYQMKASLQMDSLSHIIGQRIAVRLELASTKCTSNMHYRIAAKLTQLTTIRDVSGNIYHDEPKVVSRCDMEEPIQAQNNLTLDLDIHNDIPPSFSYSRYITVQYKLQVVIKQSRRGFGRVFSSYPSITFADIPINLGTMAYGIRAPRDLTVYSIYKSVFPRNDTSPPPSSNEVGIDLPVPKFIQTTEYPDALPLYESYQLPPYQSSSPSSYRRVVCN